jgi:signal transduction histidine kinase
MSLSTPSLVAPAHPVDSARSLRDEPLLRPLAASLAHHVNNALTGVIGHLELAVNRASAGSEVAEHLHTSLACAFRAAEAVQRIVAFACRRAESPALAPLSLRDLAEEIVAHHPSSAGVKIVRSGRPGLVLANKTLLAVVLEALIQNALEAMPEGGTLTLSEDEEDGHGCLKVSDTGLGLAPEVQARLFEPFVTTKSSGHLGLSLALCRESVAAQGGTLTVVSSPGHGTTATLSFPVAGLRVDERQRSNAPPHRSPVPLPVRQAV